MPFPSKGIQKVSYEQAKIIVSSYTGQTVGREILPLTKEEVRYSHGVEHEIDV